jgi:uncharacterized protein YjbI with pentapeptide repeats
MLDTIVRIRLRNRMPRSRTTLVFIGIVLLCQTAALRQIMAQSNYAVCIGKYKGMLQPSAAELADIRKKHAEWLNDGGVIDPKLFNDPRRANLCDTDLMLADLRGADLRGANLTGANLTYANLTSANLNGAHLNGANLTSAHLNGAHLNGADLRGANLTGANLTGADLRGANLTGANLTGAALTYANLTSAALTNTKMGNARLAGANLNGAHLSAANLSGAALTYANLTSAALTNTKMGNARLAGANLTGAYMDFDPDSPPKVLGVHDALNLQLVRFNWQPAGLVKLRSEFKDLGMRTQETQLTYAIRRSELSRTDNGHYVHGWTERTFNTVFFDWTCQYGMSPGRPLLLVADFAALFTVIYALAQCFPRLGGIWLIWDEHRIVETNNETQIVGTEMRKDLPQRLMGFPYDSSAGPRRRGRLLLSVIMLAAYFSLLSALRIGWSGLNFGTWISRMQLREYSLHATRWVRVVSGMQSLTSVYMVALAILTYFGTPFEF